MVDVAVTRTDVPIHIEAEVGGPMSVRAAQTLFDAIAEAVGYATLTLNDWATLQHFPVGTGGGTRYRVVREFDESLQQTAGATALPTTTPVRAGAFGLSGALMRTNLARISDQLAALLDVTEASPHIPTSDVRRVAVARATASLSGEDRTFEELFERYLLADTLLEGVAANAHDHRVSLINELGNITGAATDTTHVTRWSYRNPIALDLVQQVPAGIALSAAVGVFLAALRVAFGSGPKERAEAADIRARTRVATGVGAPTPSRRVVRAIDTVSVYDWAIESEEG